MKVLTVFIDGLKPESIEYLDFLNSFNVQRIKTELGYSNTCHASMYTGVYPNKHLIWFLWQFSPNSPFKWINTWKLNKIPDNIYTKYILYKITKVIKGHYYTSAFNLPFLWYMPLSHWHYFDTSEKKFWTSPQYSKEYPTIFDILQKEGIKYTVLGMSRTSLASSTKLIKTYDFDTNPVLPWTYLFFGEIDPLSHQYGQDSKKVKEKLREIDMLLSRIYRTYERKTKDDFYFMAFSDHGHAKIEKRIDIKSIFRSHGTSLKNCIYFIDSNYLRFWVRHEKEKKEILKILSTIEDKGFILSQEHLEKYHVNMPDNRYGDLIFYLDIPYTFDTGNIYLFGKEWSDTGKYISFHGYLPDYPDMDGVFISNKQTKPKYIQLEDILPSILYALNIQVPDSVDGEVIWKI